MIYRLLLPYAMVSCLILYLQWPFVLFCFVFCYLVLRGVACGSRCSSLDRWCADVRSSKAVRRPRPRRGRRVLEPRQTRREKHTIHIKQQVEHWTKLFWSSWKQKFATAGGRLVSLSVAQLVEKEEERAAAAAAAASTWAAASWNLTIKLLLLHLLLLDGEILF